MLPADRAEKGHHARSLNPAITLRAAGREDWAAIESLLNAHGLPLAGVLDHLSSFVVALSGAELIGRAHD